MEDPTRRANLLEALTDAHPSCPDVPTPASLSWSEAQIRAWFAADGRPPLDVDGITPVPASTRPDGLWICQRIGCDAAYDAAALGEDANPPGACRHHPRRARVPRREQVMELLRRQVARLRRVHVHSRVRPREAHPGQAPEKKKDRRRAEERADRRPEDLSSTVRHRRCTRR